MHDLLLLQPCILVLWLQSSKLVAWVLGFTWTQHLLFMSWFLSQVLKKNRHWHCSHSTTHIHTVATKSHCVGCFDHIFLNELESTNLDGCLWDHFLASLHAELNFSHWVLLSDICHFAFLVLAKLLIHWHSFCVLCAGSKWYVTPFRTIRSGSMN